MASGCLAPRPQALAIAPHTKMAACLGLLPPARMRRLIPHHESAVSGESHAAASGTAAPNVETPLCDEPFFLSFSEARREIVQRLRDVYVAAGGCVDAYTSVMVARFCSAYKWDERAAASAIRRAVTWRLESGASGFRAAFISGKSPLEYRNYRLMMRYIHFIPPICGTVEGDLLTHYFLGSSDIDGMCKNITAKGYDEANLIHLEWQYLQIDRESFARANGKLSRIACIIDCMNTTTATFRFDAVRHFKRNAPLVDLYYPEFMTVNIVLNTPSMLMSVWGIIRLVLSKELQSKVKFHEKGRPFMLSDFISEDCLIVRYGGKLRRFPPKEAELYKVSMLGGTEKDRILRLGGS